MTPRYSTVAADGSTAGPFTVEELRAQLASGEITLETTVVDESTGESSTAAAVTVPPGLGQAPNPGASPVGGKGPKTVWILVGVVVVVTFGCIGVLAAILLPVFAQAKLAAQKTATVSSLKQISVGALLYATDYDDLLPPDTSSGRAIEPFLRQYAPSVQFESQNPAGSAFLGNQSVAGVRIGSLAFPKRTALLLDSTPWERKTRCVGFLDGSARNVSEEAVVEGLAAGFVFSESASSGTD